ncbi:hypothetical protein [Lactobacillus sp. ESL0681]|uniref:hypothetical protein n=1 Tax=Lactobacillus sp. ESL0681 TaxID=2983211 RepID=UPI0023F764C5|nr:hypothetical protein [Lactobacillus sp. ESL0681]WEV40979.1 hypothetical protein OZX59_03415 [Lactobacillus sp. ESL0681]
MKKSLYAISILCLISGGLLISSSSQVNASDATISYQDSEEVQPVSVGTISYQDSEKIQPVSFNDDSLRSSASPNSIEGYKKLGYSNFSKSKWSGTTNVMSTKTKRVAKVITETVLSPLIVNKYAKTIYGIYTVSSAIATQHPDVWPTSNLRNIMAKTPVGYTARIGQETIIKYYSNSKRTHLFKTIHRTYWFG